MKKTNTNSSRRVERICKSDIKGFRMLHKFDEKAVVLDAQFFRFELWNLTKILYPWKVISETDKVGQSSYFMRDHILLRGIACDPRKDKASYLFSWSHIDELM